MKLFIAFLLMVSAVVSNNNAFGQCPPPGPSCSNPCPVVNTGPCPSANINIVAPAIACAGQPITMENTTLHTADVGCYTVDWDVRQDLNLNNTTEYECCPGIYSYTYNIPCVQGRESISALAGIVVTYNSACPNNPSPDNFSSIQVVYAPVASIGVLQDSLCENTPVNFINNSCPGNTPNMVYQWDFGDGNTSNAFEPTHNYVPSGTSTTYTVTLTATQTFGPCNLVDVTTLDVTIFTEPQPNIEVSTLSIPTKVFF